MYTLRSWFGSPAWGQICNDGPVRVEGPYPLDVAKTALEELCRQVRCIAILEADGMSASFENWSGSPTGGAVIERVRELSRI